MRLITSEDRAGDGRMGNPLFWVRRKMEVLRVGAEDRSPRRTGGWSGSTLSRGGRSSSSRATSLTLPLGTHEVEVSWMLSIVPRSADVSDAPSMVEWEVRQSGTVEVVPPEESLIRLVTDHEHRDAMAGVVERVRLRATSTLRGETRVSGSVEMAPSPVPIAADVVLVIGDRQWVIGQVTHDGVVSKRTQVNEGSRLTDFPEDARQATIMLRPNPSAAMLDPDIEAIWGEPIEIRDVALDRAPNRPQDDS